MARLDWDSFATLAQIGEIHHLGYLAGVFDNNATDDLVFALTKKYPRDLNRPEAARLIEDWTRKYPEVSTQFRGKIVWGMDRPYHVREDA